MRTEQGERGQELPRGYLGCGSVSLVPLSLREKSEHLRSYPSETESGAGEEAKGREDLASVSPVTKSVSLENQKDGLLVVLGIFEAYFCLHWRSYT